MDHRTRILAGALATAALGGLACHGARFNLLGGQDGGAGTAAMGGTVAGTGGAAGQGGQGGQAGQAGQAGLVQFVPVDPKISRLWRWQACGEIAPTTASALQAIFPPVGDSLAVLYDDGRVLLHPRQEGAGPRLIRPAGGTPTTIAFSLDGGTLAEVAAGVVRLRDVATGGTVRNMTVNGACTGEAVRFSAEGTHVLAWDGKSLCVWQTSDGALVGQLAGNFSSAGMANGRILTAELGSPPGVKSWTLPGLAQTQVTLEVPAGQELTDPAAPPAQGGLRISPRGDTFAGALSDVNATLLSGTFATIWSADGKLLGSFRVPGALVGNAPAYAYSASGALALLGNEVVDVASNQHWTNTAVDEELYSSIDATGRLVAGLSSLGNLYAAAATGEDGNPTARRLFGSLPQSLGTQPNAQAVLSISPDGARLATASGPIGSLLWRVAADFSASVPVRSMGQAIRLEVSFSASSREVIFSGDGWGIYSADDGAYLEGLPPPFQDAGTAGCVFTTARFSSSGRWLAVSSTQGAEMSLLADADLHEITSLPIARCQARGSFNRDDSLVAMSGPEIYRTSDWSLVWPAQIVPEPPPGPGAAGYSFRDAQFAPGDQALLVSRCDGPGGVSGCAHELRAVSDGALIQQLPEITGTQARFSGEGNWIVSGNTALHVPTSETVVFAPTAEISTFAPNGDIIAVLGDSTLARYCRTP